MAAAVDFLAFARTEAVRSRISIATGNASPEMTSQRGPAGELARPPGNGRNRALAGIVMRVIVATDGSTAADKAVGLAETLAGRPAPSYGGRVCRAPGGLSRRRLGHPGRPRRRTRTKTKRRTALRQILNAAVRRLDAARAHSKPTDHARPPGDQGARGGPGIQGRPDHRR